MGPPITKSEFEIVANEFKSKKAYGVDNIAAELLQALDEVTKYALYRLINNIIVHKTVKISGDVKKSIMVMLPKKKVIRKNV
jgi:hypothetical protein